MGSIRWYRVLWELQIKKLLQLQPQLITIPLIIIIICLTQNCFANCLLVDPSVTVTYPLTPLFLFSSCHVPPPDRLPPTGGLQMLLGQRFSENRRGGADPQDMQG
jgi:hypothetical protein